MASPSTSDNTGANADQGILLRGADETNLTNVTGGLAIQVNGDAGVTGSVTVNEIDNFVWARALGDNTLNAAGGGVTSRTPAPRSTSTR